jgi:hypothetical protein
MSTTRSINPLTRKGKWSAAQPMKVVTEVNQKILENPSEDDLKHFRSSGWTVAFEGIAIAAMPNGGVKKMHFVRMEKTVRVLTPIFKPEHLS